MVKTRRRPPENMRNTNTARTRVKRRGRVGWIFFNPTIGTYQSKKIRKKRIRQVITRSPMNILFLGLASKNSSTDCGIQIAECGIKKHKLIFRNPQSLPAAGRRTQNLLFQWKTVPTGMECPERKSRTVILLLPSNWISWIRKKSFPVSTSKKSDPIQTTFPFFPVIIPSFISPL